MRTGVLLGLAGLVALAVGAPSLGCSSAEIVNPVPLGGEGAGGGAGGGGTTGAGGALPTPPGEPVPLPVATWMVAGVAASSDEVRAAIEDGSFELPSEGSYLGASWKPLVPGENGALKFTSADYLYAAAKVAVPPGHHVFARGDTVAMMWANDASPQPGDFYHSGRIRVPLGTSDGDNLVVVRALGKRDVPEVELWSTDAELHLNTADVTAPDLVEGASFDQWIGVPVLNLTRAPAAAVQARVLESDAFEATSVEHASLPPSSATQLSFKLTPKGPIPGGGQPLHVRVRVESPSLAWPYEADVELPTVAAGSRYRHTRRSEVDGSTQYYAVMPPSGFDAAKKYGLILSLHGASVEAGGQAAAYSPKSWAYLVAPTNRRPFGFDWEEWGRLDAVEALDHALATFAIDPTRVHLTGHSMGGHGTWHVGVHHAGRFGVIAPSAGWISFDTYGGSPIPDGPIGRARAASKTLDFVDNLAARSVYIIHGAKDDNVPVAQAQTMYSTLLPIVPDLTYYEDPAGRHWWDNDADEEGADCVDWEPMIAVMEGRTLDPTELDFRFTSAGPWVSARHSFVALRSCTSPLESCVVESHAAAAEVTVTTTNVRSLELDGAALLAKGIQSAVVDGVAHPVSAAPLAIGPAGGKTATVSGPLNQVFQRPFCFVYEDQGPDAYRQYAAYLVSWWAVLGNGQACAVARSALDAALGTTHNLVYLGVPPAAIPGATDLPFTWDDQGITVGGTSVAAAAVAFVFPEGDRLSAAFEATPGSEYLLFRYMPFSSRSGMPDFFVWTAAGVQASGFLDADWQLAPAYSTGL